MKISNFRDYTKCIGPDPEFPHSTRTISYALIDVTTGFIFRKTVERRIVKRGRFWQFFDDGEFVPTYVDSLEQEYLNSIAKEAVPCL